MPEHLLEVVAEERVELGSALGREVVAVPPEPVAALRPRGTASYAFSKRSGGISARTRSSAVRACPSSVQARLSSGWPIQIRKLDSIQLPEWMRDDPPARRARGDLLARKHRRHLAAQARIERFEESLAGARIVLPGVLAVERHA